MKIRVEIDIPEGMYCDIRGNKCKHYRYYRQSQKWKCEIFKQPLNRQPMPGKTCYCYNCGKWFHPLGIARHRAMHRDRKEDCTILDANTGSITYCNFKE